MNIGIVIPSETYLFSPWEYNYYFTELLRGIIAAASLFESNISILHRGFNEEKGYVELAGNIDFKGLIVLAPVLTKESSGELKEVRKPTILINSRYSQFNYIDSDNEHGASLAVEYLMDMGHRKIAFISGKYETENAKKRLQGYRSVMTDRGLLDKKIIRHGDFSKDSGYHEMMELLNLKERPTAVFCSNDLMALGAIKAAKEKELSVPDDVSVVGFDDLVISKYFTPPLTSVRQPLFHIGKEALIVLMGIIHGEKSQPQQVEIKTRLIVRESVKKIN